MPKKISFLQKLKLLWFAFTDERTPTIAKAAIIIGALYGVSPLDLIPDFIPVLGQLDDVAVLIAAFMFFLRLTQSIREDLQKKSNEIVVEPIKRG